MINLNKSSSISRRHKFSFAIDDDLLISSDLIEMWGEGSHVGVFIWVKTALLV